MGIVPSNEIFQNLGKNALLCCSISPHIIIPFIKNNNISLPGNILHDDYDSFCELIKHEETCGYFHCGYSDGLVAGFNIGLPPLLLFGNELIKKKAHDVIM